VVYIIEFFIPDSVIEKFPVLDPGLIKTYFEEIFIYKKCIISQDDKINILFIFASVNK